MEVRIGLWIFSAVLAAISAPMAMRRVPPNPLYGFRTPRTLEDHAVWYEANAFAGRALLGAAFAIAIATAILHEQVSEGAPGPLVIIMGPMAAAVAVSFLYLANLATRP